METYILLVWIAGYQRGAGLAAEFMSKPACENAATQVENEFDDVFSEVNTLCVPKG